MFAKRFWRFISIALCLALVFSACAPAPAEEAAPVEDVTPAEDAAPAEDDEPEEEVSAEPLKVAVLLPGPIADGGWNMLAYEGVLALQDDPDFEVAYTESLPQADMPPTTRGYADDGYDLIVGHGFQFVSSFLEIAPEYPDTYFFATSTVSADEDVPPNLMFIDVQAHFGGYMVGALAALVSETGTVGIVGGGDNPIQRSIAHAFTQGAEETVPGTTGLMVITGDYNDAARGREAALTMIGNGADVIFHWANVTGLGAIMACVESGVGAIGVYSDQSSMHYGTFVSSLTMDLEWIVTSVAHAVRDGNFEGGGNWAPSFDDMYKFKIGDALYNSSWVSDDAAATMEQVISDIHSGDIVVDVILD